MSVNLLNETTYTEVYVGVNVPCARQVMPGKSNRETMQIIPGKFNTKKVTYWLSPTDIEEGDKMIMIGSDYSDDIREVEDVRDAAGRGHHLEVIVGEVTPQGEGDRFHG